jgi:capsular polysaccharide biosynthesis protein
MELKELINAYTKERNLIVGLVMVGLILSLVVYLLPAKYVSSGSLIVTRNTQRSDEYFTYEGYYAQQTASEYTGTVEPLLEGLDVRKKALEKIGVEADQYNLRKLRKDTKVKRDGNQLLILEVKDHDKEIAAEKWNAIAESLIEVSAVSNKKSDPDLNIVMISSVPITKMVYRSIWIYLMTGIFSGLLFGVIKVSFSEYLTRS